MYVGAALPKQVGEGKPCMSLMCSNPVYITTIVWACKQIGMLMEDPVISSVSSEGC